MKKNMGQVLGLTWFQSSLTLLLYAPYPRAQGSVP